MLKNLLLLHIHGTFFSHLHAPSSHHLPYTSSPCLQPAPSYYFTLTSSQHSLALNTTKTPYFLHFIVPVPQPLYIFYLSNISPSTLFLSPLLFFLHKNLPAITYTTLLLKHYLPLHTSLPCKSSPHHVFLSKPSHVIS